MYEIGPEHPLTYRQEVVAPLFRHLQARDSCAVAGPSSMGKSRLIQFIQRPDVCRHYLAEQAEAVVFALADCNRLAEVSEWGFYELLLTALIEASGQHPAAAELRDMLNSLRAEAIRGRDALLARRQAELAAQILCREQNLTVCLLLDEFDEAYRRLPAAALANLRALRDANKYRLCYLLMLRETPARLRPPDECEGLYELFSRAVLGLGPYTAADAGRIVEQLAARKRQCVPPELCARIVALSGGHPGLMIALFEALAGRPERAEADWPGWGAGLPAAAEECRKLWRGLADDERMALSRIVQGLPIADDVRDVLRLKGLIRADNRAERCFSPLFARHIQMQESVSADVLMIDEAAGVVELGGRAIKLTSHEFDVLALLYRHKGDICSRDQILAYVYPKETRHNKGLSDDRVDTLIKRIREKIEPVRAHPRYVITVRGKGYKLDTGE
jgi:DNA-binding winged helix-turn-helix (wHTH) protein